MLFSRNTPDPGVPDEVTINDASAGVVLGSLRSLVDEPLELPEPFERIALVYDGILRAYRRRALTADEAASRLALLRLRSDEDVEWTLGASTARWYRRYPGGDWKLGIPERLDSSLTASADAAIESIALMDAPNLAAEHGNTGATADSLVPAVDGEARQIGQAEMATALESTEITRSGYDRQDSAESSEMATPSLALVTAVPVEDSGYGHASPYGEDGEYGGPAESGPVPTVVPTLELADPTLGGLDPDGGEEDPGQAELRRMLEALSGGR